MLSREIMGMACLGVVWVTALLVAAAAWQDLRDLRRIARRARHAIVGTVETEDFAVWTVDQTARAVDVSGDEAVAFHDRGFASDIRGGTLRTSDKAYEVSPSKDGQVWVERATREAAAACANPAAFDDVYAQARKAKGYHRDVHVRIGKGERVFVVGAIEGATIVPEIVSTFDPAAHCVRKSLLVVAFIPIELAVCGAATWLALQLPHFGKTSIAGALCCFAFFLGVTPIAVAIRERVRRPHESFLRVQWSRGAKEAAPAQRLTQRKT